VVPIYELVRSGSHTARCGWVGAVLWSPYTGRCGVSTDPMVSAMFMVSFRHFQVQKVRRSAHPHFTRVARRERPTSTYNITSHSPSSIFCQSSSLTCFKSAVIKRGRANKIPKNNTTDIIFFIFKINKSKTTQRLPVLPQRLRSTKLDPIGLITRRRQPCKPFQVSTFTDRVVTVIYIADNYLQ